MNQAPTSWGRYPQSHAASIIDAAWTHEIDTNDAASVIAYGLGRSYGDVCLNHDGTVVRMHRCDRILSFDHDTGIVRAEAGLSIADLLRVCVPHGWFIPVTPGTRYVTLGGAVANDIHGKNHHRVGTFGRHVRALTLLRSTGDVLRCAPTENSELFAATIAGMGLTGIVLDVEIALLPIASRRIIQESIKARSLSELVELTDASDAEWDYTVSWIDVMSRGSSLGRGLVLRGRFSEVADATLKAPWKGPLLSIPSEAPGWLLSTPTIKIFNSVWYNKQLARQSRTLIDLEPFFYPLDGIGNWNLLYGRRGMLQYQCVVPNTNGQEVMREILRRMQLGGISSFLAVLKKFGDLPSPGIMSFPRPGLTLTLDIPIGGQRMFDALDDCDRIVHSVGGRVYAAKDARVRGSMFRSMYSDVIDRFRQSLDPAMSSSFWRRIMNDTKETM
ncbi:MAG: FAD-binding oxidoreductase [Candidatus Kapabacteria bacterium]|nr:FAD-binding oxidoreductase [Candidatus Kapabacteria bacterium]